MISIPRYKQLYNALTHSKAFIEKDAVLHSEVVNKNAFTPHNLKSLLISGNGVIACYYTPETCGTNSSTIRRIDFVSCDDSNETKGIIDALFLGNGLKFNNLEEILILGDSFNTTKEYQRELNAVNIFAEKVENGQIAMPRLMGICEFVRNNVEFSEKNIDSTKLLVNQLKNIGLSIKSSKKFEPKRDEVLGTLPNVCLNSGDYILDTQYSPDLPKEEQNKKCYRLSKYFYDEQERARQAIARKQEEEKAKAEEEEKKRLLEQKAKREREIFEQYEATYGEAIDSTVKKITNVYSFLYSSNYSGIIGKPLGILTSMGLIDALSEKKPDRSTIQLSNNKQNTTFFAPLYKSIITAIETSCGSKFDGFNLPTSDMLSSRYFTDISADTNKTVFYPLQVRLCYGYFSINDGLKKFLIKKGAFDGYSAEKILSTVKVTNYSLFNKYITEELKKNIYKVFEINGIPSSNPTEDEVTKSNKILEKLKGIFTNTITIPEHKKGECTEIRMCLPNEIDTDKFCNALCKLKSAENVELASKLENSYIFRIIWNEEELSKSILFAKNVLDGVIESGSPPSWSHALLGKDEKGNALFWDRFKGQDISERLYCLYAKSRAGKGIMTSTLLCNALCNGYKVMYFDGKPENSVGTGKIAWSQGKEAMMFDGRDLRSAPYTMCLEDYTNGLRSEGMKYQSIDKIPDGIFTENEKKEFIALTTYIRGIELTMKMTEYRSKHSLSDEDWVITVFDEIKAMSEKDNEISNKLDKIKNSSSCSYMQKKWIDSWFSWKNSLVPSITDATSINFGKANMNIFFIFQGSDWYGTCKNSFIFNDFLSPFLKISLKIVGKNGVSGKGADAKSTLSETGNGISANYDWVKYINAENHSGTWAITGTSSVGACKEMENVKIFKPFNIYLEPQDKDLEGKSEEEQEEIRNDKTYMLPYIQKLFDAVGMQQTPAEVLESAFIYSDTLVKELGLADSILDFMYNAHSFNVDGIKGSDLKEGIADDEKSRALHIFTQCDNAIEELILKLDKKYISEQEKIVKSKDQTVFEAKKQNLIDTVKNTDYMSLCEIIEKFRFADISEEDKGIGDLNLNLKVENYIGKVVSDLYKLQMGSSIAYVPTDMDNSLHITLDKSLLDERDTTISRKNDVVYDENEEIDLFGDTEEPIKPTPIENHTAQPIQRPTMQQRTMPQQTIPQQTIPQQTMPQQTMPQQTMPQWEDSSNAYRGQIHIEDNPFKTYEGDSNTCTLLSMKEITSIIMEDIDKNIGNASLITDFAVLKGGRLSFNGITYLPTFENSFLADIPLTLRKAIEKGKMIEFFDLGKVYKYKNLETFVIEDENLAQGRARKEMGIGFRKRWNVLFRKFNYLGYIKVGEIEYSINNPDNNGEDSWLDKFMNNKISTYSTDRNSRMDKVWDSKPVRIMANAFGWTLGVQAVWLAASLFGPIGLLFGAFATVGAVKEIKDSRNELGQFQPRNSKNQLENTRKSLPKQSSKEKKKKRDKEVDGFSPIKKN